MNKSLTLQIKTQADSITALNAKLDDVTQQYQALVKSKPAAPADLSSATVGELWGAIWAKIKVIK